MTGFADRMQQAGRAGAGATIEVGHRETRTGIVVQVDGLENGQALAHVLRLAFERAAHCPRPMLTQPGWWAWQVAAAAGGLYPTQIQRAVYRLERHAVVVVERGSMVEQFPDWPMCRTRVGGPWLDMRGDAALAIGPSDAELAAYAARANIDLKTVPVRELRRMFEVGVLQWAVNPSGAGKRAIHAAG